MDKVFLYWWFTQYQENKTVALGLFFNNSGIYCGNTILPKVQTEFYSSIRHKRRGRLTDCPSICNLSAQLTKDFKNLMRCRTYRPTIFVLFWNREKGVDNASVFIIQEYWVFIIKFVFVLKASSVVFHTLKCRSLVVEFSCNFACFFIRIYIISVFEPTQNDSTRLSGFTVLGAWRPCLFCSVVSS